jgi:hypothetical protein
VLTKKKKKKLWESLREDFGSDAATNLPLPTSSSLESKRVEGVGN